MPSLLLAVLALQARNGIAAHQLQASDETLMISNLLDGNTAQIVHQHLLGSPPHSYLRAHGSKAAETFLMFDAIDEAEVPLDTFIHFAHGDIVRLPTQPETAASAGD